MWLVGTAKSCKLYEISDARYGYRIQTIQSAGAVTHKKLFTLVLIKL